MYAMLVQFSCSIKHALLMAQIADCKSSVPHVSAANYVKPTVA